MVGNDIVDLLDRDSDPSTLHPRFDERVFAPHELRALQSSADPSFLRWRFWAAKEAAYKAVKKVHPQAVFSPVRFRVALFAVGDDATERGTVRCDVARCEVRVETRDGFVHAVARVAGAGMGGRLSPSGRLFTEVLRVAPSDQDTGDGQALGRSVRALARSRIARELGVSPDALEIRKQGRVPQVWLRGAPAACDLSLSHHGGCVAFACELAAPTLSRVNGNTIVAAPGAALGAQ
jgi:hypothetical protein